MLIPMKRNTHRPDRNVFAQTPIAWKEKKPNLIEIANKIR